ncbi:MAG: M14 family metallopeptidase [Pseudomonadales bacterium]
MGRLHRRALALLLLVAALAAGGDLGAWPGGDHDPAIPTLTAVIGHDFGADLSDPDDIARYLAALHQAAPARTRLVEYARSWQGRPLHYLVIGSAERIAALDDVQAGLQRLADPRGAGSAELEGLVETLPAVVWLAHGVHGNEVTSSDAALLTAYHLLASRRPETAALLDSLLVVVDPLQNPDGRARFVHHYRSHQGLVPQPSPIAAERVEPWPSGRTNHYLFDMNRDWFAQTQPETRGRAAAFLAYRPHVYADVHEMGTDRTYYFPPPAQPWNPYLNERQNAAIERFGRAMAERFDRRGFRYFTREDYDAYYPGYGDTWPTLHGAAGMTFEMASPRGLLGQRSDGSVVSYRDGVDRHFTASLATLEAAAADRARLLEDFLAMRRASGPDTTYVLPRRGDAGRVDKLADLLRRQGIEVRRLPDAGRVCGESVPAGSYLVSTQQPAGPLAGTLLAADSPARAEFWAEQERRLARHLPAQVYDVVAWSLPLLFDVESLSCRLSVASYPLMDAPPPGPPAPVTGSTTVAYLVPWGSQAATRFLAAALREGLPVFFTTHPFSRGERRFPGGTLIVRRAGEPADPAARVAALAAASGAEVVAIDGTWVDAGVDFGSDHVRRARAPRIALAWGEPATVTDTGALRYAVERKLGYPLTPVRTADLASPWLDQFDVLVLPDGDDYAKALPAEAADNLGRWVRRGGTLVGIGGALAYLGSEAVGLLASRPELRAAPDSGDSEPPVAGPGVAAGSGSAAAAPEEDGPVPGTILATEADLDRAVAAKEAAPPEISGVLLQAVTDDDHWLAMGLPARLPIMFSGARVFTPLPLDKGTNALRFAAAERLVLAGYLWTSVRPQLAFKPAAMVQPEGRGQVIAFVADPAFRGVMDGLDVLLANALLLGPAMASPVPPAP